MVKKVVRKKSAKKVSKKNVQKKLTPKQKQEKEHNKILRGVLIFLGFLVLIFGGIMWSYNSANYFTYDNLEFEKYIEGSLVFYRTSFPILYQGEETKYNIYIRTNPNELKEVDSDAEIWLMTNMVINGSDNDNFDCNGDAIIAFANLVKFYQVIGANVIKDENATCDPEGRYIYVSFVEGDVTEVRELGNACYEVSVADCEILKGTEKFLVESIAQFKRETNY